MNNFGEINSSSDSYQMNEQTLAQEISKVYYWMFFGLLTTFGVGYGISQSFQNEFLELMSTPLMYVFLFAPLGIVVYLSVRINNMTASTAATWFLVFAAIQGLLFTTIFLTYNMPSIILTLGVTSITFFIMASFGYITKTDLTSMGKLLIFALIGIIISLLINIFLNSSMFHMLISAVGVLVFSGLIAYKTQQIKVLIINEFQINGKVGGRAVIISALSLYLSFINLFLMLLQFLGGKKGE